MASETSMLAQLLMLRWFAWSIAGADEGYEKSMLATIIMMPGGGDGDKRWVLTIYHICITARSQRGRDRRQQGDLGLGARSRGGVEPAQPILACKLLPLPLPTTTAITTITTTAAPFTCQQRHFMIPRAPFLALALKG